jgi:hypothetical protein
MLLVGLAAIAMVGDRLPPSRFDLQLMAEMGPIPGWLCLRQPSYSYEPSRHWLDGGLLAEAPEAVVRAVAAQAEVERVEINLRTGDATVWTRLGDSRRHVYVLAPGTLTVVADRDAAEPPPLCTTHLSNWQIVGEHSPG